MNALALDIGGTAVKAGVVNREGEILFKTSIDVETMRRSGDLINALVNELKPIVEKHAIRKIGIGVPGLLSADRRAVLEAPNVKEFTGTEFYPRLSAAFPDCTIRLENDANTAALGALCFDTSFDSKTFAFVTLGTGIGSAVVVDGKLFTGSGNALELGFVLSRNGEYLEKVIARDGLIKMAKEMAASGKYKTAIDLTCITPEQLAKAASANDELAKALFGEMGTILGEALTGFIYLFDVPTIYIGGGIAAAYNHFMPSLKKVLDAKLLNYYKSRLHIKHAEVGNDAGILGAAALCFVE